MKKLLFTMASLVMLASASFAQEEPTPMLPSQHGLTDHQPAWGSSQTFDLSTNWNWWSTYVNVTDITELETALNGHAIQIKSSNSAVTYQESTDSWLGSFDLDITKMYMIKMSTAYDEATLRGPRANIDGTEIPVQQGWNWVGYPVNFTMPAQVGLTNYTASYGDLFKGSQSFVTYTGTEWLGTLQLEPGKGYKLKSTAEGTSTYAYPSSYEPEGRIVDNTFDNTTKWQPQMASNPDNMNMIAVVSLDNEELRSNNMEIGVFNGETCRGAVRPHYSESLDRYFFLLTMYGEDNEPYQFRLFDHETGDIYESNEVSVSFKADDVLGSVRSPFELKFNTQGMIAGNLHLFPNPVNQGEMVNMILPEGNVTVEVVNMLGSIVKSVRMAGSELSADMAPGVYTVKVIDGEGHVYMDKLIVK